jgi:hypothetical protein
VVHTGFWWGDLKEIYHLEDVGLDGRVILKRVFNRYYGDVDWIDLVEGGEK